MIFQLLCSATTAAARNVPQDSFRCLDGRRYRISSLNDALVASETADCCEGYKLFGNECKETFSTFNVDPQVLARFCTAIGLLLLGCLLVAIISMLIAYKMFYKRHGRADPGEKVTLAEDLDTLSTSTCAQ